MEGGAVHAVAQSGRPRAVGEDVAKVAAAADAVDLSAVHAEARVRAFGDGVGQQKLGQPVRLSYFVVDGNSGRSQPAQTYVPARASTSSGLEKGGSVPSHPTTSKAVAARRGGP